MEASVIRDIILRFASARIGVLGDMMLDRFIYGEARRISPEAPVPVVRVSRRASIAGGAANVAANIVAMGGSVSLFGAIGADEAGKELRAVLEAGGAGRIDMSGLLLPTDYSTTVKTRVVAQSQQLLRIDEEETSVTDTGFERSLLELVCAAMAADKIDLLVISDYAKGVITGSLLKALRLASYDSKCAVLVDPKPSNTAHYTGADLIKPNLGEALQILNMDAETFSISDERMQEVCMLLMGQTGTHNVIVTAGANGVYLIGSGKFHHIAGHPREIYDVAGAGDTTMAAIALAAAVGAAWYESAWIGNLAGSLAITKLGVATVSADELLAELASEQQLGTFDG